MLAVCFFHFHWLIFVILVERICYSQIVYILCSETVFKTRHDTTCHTLDSIIYKCRSVKEREWESKWVFVDRTAVCNTRWFCVECSLSLCVCLCVWINARNTEYTDVGLKIRTLCVMTKWKKTTRPCQRRQYRVTKTIDIHTDSDNVEFHSNAL